jgi:hypothetical protein
MDEITFKQLKVEYEVKKRDAETSCQAFKRACLTESTNIPDPALSSDERAEWQRFHDDVATCLLTLEVDCPGGDHDPLPGPEAIRRMF